MLAQNLIHSAKSTALLISFILTFMLPTLVAAENQRTISLTGKGSVNVIPDMAIVSVGKVTEAKSASRALTENSKTVNALISAFKKAGVKSKSIKTSGFSVRPLYNRNLKKSTISGREHQQIVGYRVTNNLSIQIQGLDKIGELLDKIVKLGANSISDISFTHSNFREAMNRARRSAVENALAKAALFVDAASVNLGEILTITDGNSRKPPIHSRAVNFSAARASSVPIEPGEQTISAQVHIIWSIE